MFTFIFNLRPTNGGETLQVRSELNRCLTDPSEKYFNTEHIRTSEQTRPEKTAMIIFI